MQANLARCVGIGCKLSWAVMALAIVLKYVFTFSSGVTVMLCRVSSADIMIACWRLTLRSFVSWTTAGDAIPLTASALMLLTATLLNQSLAFAWTEMRRARPRYCEIGSSEPGTNFAFLTSWWESIAQIQVKERVIQNSGQNDTDSDYICIQTWIAVALCEYAMLWPPTHRINGV